MSKSPVDIVLTAVIIGVFLLLAIQVIDTAASGVGRDEVSTVDDESFVANHSVFVSLDNDYLLNGTEVVYNSTGAEMTKGDDYEMDYEDGEIKTLSSGNITDGSTCEISYDYEHKSEQLTGMIDLFSTLLNMFGMLPVILGALALIVIISSFKSGGN